MGAGRRLPETWKGWLVPLVVLCGMTALTVYEAVGSERGMRRLVWFCVLMWGTSVVHFARWWWMRRH